MDAETTAEIGKLVAEAVDKEFTKLKKKADPYLQDLGEAAEKFQKMVPGGDQLEGVAESIQGTDNNGVAASNQALYWSTQFFKFDPALFTIAPNAIEWNPGRGFSFFGGQEHRIPVGRAMSRIPGLRALRRGRENGQGDDGGSGSADGAIVELREALSRHSTKLGKHATAIAELARGQRHLAVAATEPTAARARRAERSAALSPVRRQAHREAARELRELEGHLRQTERSAANLERELAGS